MKNHIHKEAMAESHSDSGNMANDLSNPNPEPSKNWQQSANQELDWHESANNEAATVSLWGLGLRV